MGQKSNTAFSLNDLAYYFDAQERDRLDRGGLGRKNGQVLMLRERLLQLPDPQFDLAVRTLEQMVSSAQPTATLGRKASDTPKKDAMDLFQGANQAAQAARASDRPDIKISVV